MNKFQYFDDLLIQRLKITTCESFLRSLYDFPLHFSHSVLGEMLQLSPVPTRLLKDNLILTPFYNQEQMLLLIPRSLCYRQLLRAHPRFSMHARALGGGAYATQPIHPTANKPSTRASHTTTYSGISFAIQGLRDHPAFRPKPSLVHAPPTTHTPALTQILQEFSKNDTVL